MMMKISWTQQDVQSIVVQPPLKLADVSQHEVALHIQRINARQP
jgi:hypothetical protein